MELARRIDATRGQVPFDRFVRETLEQALGGQGSGDTRAVSKSAESGSVKETRATEHPAPARASEPPPDDLPPKAERLAAARRHLQQQGAFKKPFRPNPKS